VIIRNYQVQLRGQPQVNHKKPIPYTIKAYTYTIYIKVDTGKNTVAYINIETDVNTLRGQTRTRDLDKNE